MSDEKKDQQPEKKKIRINPVEFAMFCDHASVSMDGKLSLNGIFDRLFAKEVPVTHTQMFIVSKLILPPGDHKVTFSLMQQDSVLSKASLEKKTDKLGVHTHFWNVKNLKIDSWEPIELQILIGGKQIYVKRMPIVKAEEKKK
ncbi:hypothetical protein HOD30_03605 [Candidatus Peregrinibacteria bacterium]|jgi:hypothetical protein|nr:hypothetical protein [Candidatus Peregrinibacteria bacterium]MBT4631605.1 hypothetical protein [Candidatus Peregrinibacteria bacterium]MBT5516611.1 hypothetical protein [Candidatus Peregrinibacteria bacterium]MBT5823698.1 hypothetical protein [Candidatus Peregrinibacteria bacterium]